MKIGILSDTHGNLQAVDAAVRLFARAGVGAVFHCGDIGSFDVLAGLAGLGVPVHAVLGNVDEPAGGWRFFPAGTGVHLHGRFGEVEMEGRRIALLHGDDAQRLRQAAESGKYDLLLSGHTHEAHDRVLGATRCLNPGSAARGAPDTCAWLDLDTGKWSVAAI